LRGLETYVAGQAALIINYGAARHDAEPITTAPTESTVQWLLHRRMGAKQQMRWSPQGAHMMLKVRTAVANGTFERDHAVAERWADARFAQPPDPPPFGRSLLGSLDGVVVSAPIATSPGSRSGSRWPPDQASAFTA
jgi:hypothetical protein